MTPAPGSGPTSGPTSGTLPGSNGSGSPPAPRPRDPEEVARHEAHLVGQIYHLIDANQRLEEQIDRLSKVSAIAGLFRDRKISSDTFELPEPRVVAPHVVIVGRLVQQGGRTVQEDAAGLVRAAHFVKAKGAVDISGHALRICRTKPGTNGERLFPPLGAHDDEQSHLKHFFAGLIFWRNGLDFLQGVIEHFEFDIALRGKQRAFKRHVRAC